MRGGVCRQPSRRQAGRAPAGAQSNKIATAACRARRLPRLPRRAHGSPEPPEANCPAVRSAAARAPRRRTRAADATACRNKKAKRTWLMSL